MLTVVATPIGHPKDITLRALETLRKADLVICEELRVGETNLKKWGIEGKTLEELNEHSGPDDYRRLAEIVKTKNVALISDCGTPGFCDPGAELVDMCFKLGLKVDVNPGPSSLMALISIAGMRFSDFYFVGFLPQKEELRKIKLETLKRENRSFIIMDTPYRLQKTVAEFAGLLPERIGVLGIDLTGQDQKVERGPLKVLAQKTFQKNPFILLVV